MGCSVDRKQGGFGRECAEKIDRTSVQPSRAKKVLEARLYAELSDEIDHHLGDKKDYRGIGQYYLGKYYLEKKNYETALALADNILKRNSSSHYGHLLKGRVKILVNIDKPIPLHLHLIPNFLK